MDTIIIAITDTCNLRCMGCYNSNKSVMKLPDFKRIIDKIPVPKSITLTGGEPFLHPDLNAMVDYVNNKKKIKPRIVTSGYANPEQLTKLKDKIELLTVTIKYLNDTIDSAWRRAKNTFVKSVKFLDKAFKLKITLAINWIADNQNYTDLYLLQQFASKYNATLEIVRFIPYKEELQVFGLDENRWNELCEHANKFANVHIAFPSKFSYLHCVAGISRIYINTIGDIYPCIYVNEPVGNIFKDDFDKIVFQAENWRILNSTFKGSKIEGCIGLLKTYPQISNRPFDQQNVELVIERLENVKVKQ